jgi:hypothetical protein
METIDLTADDEPPQRQQAPAQQQQQRQPPPMNANYAASAAAAMAFDDGSSLPAFAYPPAGLPARPAQQQQQQQQRQRQLPPSVKPVVVVDGQPPRAHYAQAQYPGRGQAGASGNSLPIVAVANFEAVYPPHVAPPLPHLNPSFARVHNGGGGGGGGGSYPAHYMPPNAVQQANPYPFGMYTTVGGSYTYALTLVDSYRFAVRADGFRPLKEHLDALTGKKGKELGFEFDREKNAVTFPLQSHDIICTVIASMKYCSVDRLPQQAIQAAQMRRERDAKQKDTKDTTHEENVLKLLRDEGVMEKMLQALAPFQREAVAFVHANHGRALIADEMGLGTCSRPRPRGAITLLPP